jgi:hypothetical protein
MIYVAKEITATAQEKITTSTTMSNDSRFSHLISRFAFLILIGIVLRFIESYVIRNCVN